jgi:hypothetical protein
VRDLKLKEIKYCLIRHMLYWKYPLGFLLICLDPQEAQKTMTDFHDNLCGGHHFWRTTSYKILKSRNFWPILFTDFCENIRSHEKCQKFPGKQQLKYFPLNPVVVYGPFQHGDLNSLGKFIQLQVVNTGGL